MKTTRLKNDSLYTAICFVLTSCLGLFSLTTIAAGEESPAAILGFQRTGGTLEFTVISTGCTTEDHFKLHISAPEALNSDQQSDGQTAKQTPIQITLVRTQKDRCRRMPGPRVITMEIPKNHASDVAIIITNSFVALRARG